MKVLLLRAVIVHLLKLMEISVYCGYWVVNVANLFDFIYLVHNLVFVSVHDCDFMGLLAPFMDYLFHSSDFNDYYVRFETFLEQRDNVDFLRYYDMVVRFRIYFVKDALGSWWSVGSVQVLFGWF